MMISYSAGKGGFWMEDQFGSPRALHRNWDCVEQELFLEHARGH